MAAIAATPRKEKLMYAQMVETGVKAVQGAADMSDEERAFQARIDADIKIEPKDWMPEAYRRTLIARYRSMRTPKLSVCCRKAIG
jgi:hypothetical protein